MTTFFSSDTHFGHANIVRLSNRPFADVDEMNRTLIENFNSVAGAADTIYLLGDACLGKLDDSLPLIAKIEARVVLKVGNHDRPSLACQRKGDVATKVAAARERYLEVFDEVLLDGEDTVDVQGQTFAISHYPFAGDHYTEDRFPHLRPKNTGLPLLHGHVHELWKFNGRQFNVGVDVNGFHLVSEEEVLAWKATL